VEEEATAQQAEAATATENKNGLKINNQLVVMVTQ